MPSFTEQQIKELKEARDQLVKSGIVLSVCVTKLAQVQIVEKSEEFIKWLNEKSKDKKS